MTSNPVLSKALLYGGILTGVIAVVGSVVGLLVAGVPGLVSALVGAVLAAVFMALTAVSMLIAERVAPGGAANPLYFAFVVGALFVKFVVFLIVTLALRGQPWLQPYLYFGAVIVAVIGSLVADGLALQRARVPYVGDVALPEDSASDSSPRKP